VGITEHHGHDRQTPTIHDGPEHFLTLPAPTTRFPGQSGLTLTKTADGTWELTGRAMVPHGTYYVQIDVKDDQNATTSVNVTIVVGLEDATIEYTGDSLVSTSRTSNTSTASVNLSALVKETDSELGNKLPGLKVLFTLYAGNDYTMSKIFPCGGNSTTGVTLVSAGSGSATASCTANLTADDWTVKVDLMTNDYYKPVDGLGAVTVVPPGNGFTTGGGWFMAESQQPQQLRVDGEVPEERQRAGEQPLHLPEGYRPQRPRSGGAGRDTRAQLRREVQLDAGTHAELHVDDADAMHGDVQRQSDDHRVDVHTGIAYSLCGNWHGRWTSKTTPSLARVPAPVRTRAPSACGTATASTTGLVPRSRSRSTAATSRSG
jgi:hypothetical protein